LEIVWRSWSATKGVQLSNKATKGVQPAAPAAVVETMLLATIERSDSSEAAGSTHVLFLS